LGGASSSPSCERTIPVGHCFDRFIEPDPKRAEDLWSAGSGPGWRAIEAKVREQMVERPEVVGVVQPLLTVWRTVRDQIAGLDRPIMTVAKEDPPCRLPDARVPWAPISA
jgi:hypothetical protein